MHDGGAHHGTPHIDERHPSAHSLRASNIGHALKIALAEIGLQPHQCVFRAPLVGATLERGEIKAPCLRLREMTIGEQPLSHNAIQVQRAIADVLIGGLNEDRVGELVGEQHSDGALDAHEPLFVIELPSDSAFQRRTKFRIHDTPLRCLLGVQPERGVFDAGDDQPVLHRRIKREDIAAGARPLHATLRLAVEDQSNSPGRDDRRLLRGCRQAEQHQQP